MSWFPCIAGLVAGVLMAACSSSTGDLRESVAESMIELDPLAPGGTYLTVTVDPADDWPAPALIGHAPPEEPGRRLFYRNWLAKERNGKPLAGPGLDDATCAGCHIEMARAGDRTLDYAPLLIARPVSEPGRQVLGAQVHRFRVANQAAAARLEIEYVSSPFRYPDGTMRRLRSPHAHAVSPDGRRFPVALRAAPLLFGWGLLERVDREMLAHFHDPDDRDGDGISGRMARTKEGAIGLLGWKAGHAELRAQIGTALAHDMGVTSESACMDEFDSACSAEISVAELDALTDYVRHIGVPARRPATTPRGQNLFGRAGCAQCHVSVLQTLPDERAALDRQWAWAFTDLMLHDMGPALADPGDSPDAREWRTAPLWGVGIAERVLPERGFLHDGRARSLEEAVLWHGGEAAPAREAFAEMPAADREALLEFVRSL